MRRYIKPILLRIPAVQRYLDEKRAIAAALEEAKAKSDHLGGELASLRGRAEVLAAERNALRDEAKQLGITAKSLGAERDRLRDEAEQLGATAKSLGAERDRLHDEIEQFRATAKSLGAARDTALEQIEQTRSELASLSAKRDNLERKLEQANLNADVLSAERDTALDRLKQAHAATERAALERDAAREQLGLVSVVLSSEREAALSQANRRERLAQRQIEQDVGAIAQRLRQHRINGPLLQKDVVLTITPGRSGTRLLAVLLSRVLGADARHEPEPRATLWVRPTLDNPLHGIDWLIREKLPAIAATPNRLYIETSHFFGKGLIEPMLMLGLRPRFIILRRNCRDVAKSHLMMNVVPSRNEEGYLILTNPSDPNSLPLPNWQDYSDYQLCYWYAKDIERRQTGYRGHFDRNEIPYIDITLEELIHWDSFLKVCEFVDPIATARGLSRKIYNEVVSSNQNPREAAHVGNVDRVLPTDLEEQEHQVDLACAAYDLSSAINVRGMK